MNAGWYRTPLFARLLDAALALASLAPALLASIGYLQGLSQAPWVFQLAGWSLLAAVALMWRRQYPRAVFGIELVLALLTLPTVPYVLPPLATVIALGTVASRRPWREGLIATGLTLLPVLPGLGLDRELDVLRSCFLLGFVAAGWASGQVARARRHELQWLHDRARTAVAEEQARIARELHDTIAHHVSVIVVQSSVAEDMLDGEPQQARGPLRAIGGAGREALAELRLLLDGDGSRVAALDPQPRLDRLPALAEQVGAAGLPVTVTIDGPARPLPTGVELSAYRIVQEALTNALRHARASSAQVHLRYGAAAVELEVRDDGVGVAPKQHAGGGHGLAGMRERVALLGGRLDAGPHDGGGFRVRALLPVEAA